MNTEYHQGRGLAYTTPPLMIREYHGYCMELLRTALHASVAPFNIVVGDTSVTFRNALPSLHIGLQIEHTLVRAGGRDSAGAEAGSIQVDGTAELYLVRVVDQAKLAHMDLVIDYSHTNLVNVRNHARLAELSRRHIVIAPLLGATDLYRKHRCRNMITLFADTSQPRRRALLQAARERRLPLRNIAGVYALPQLRLLYHQTRILLNIRQTEHHHTLEELRVLPALLCGVIVISESVPLQTHVPYHEFIVWAPYEQLLQTAEQISADYARHWQRLFGDGRLQALLEDMREANVNTLDQALAECAKRVLAHS